MDAGDAALAASRTRVATQGDRAVTSRAMIVRAAWLLVVAQLAAGSARAQPAPPAAPPPVAPAEPSPSPPAELPPPGPGPGPAGGDAAAHLELGVAAYSARDYPRAARELLEANRLAPELADPYRWLALTDVQIGDCPSALINIDAFAARAPAADGLLPELVALRDRCLYTGAVAVESTPTGAAIRIDGGPPIATTPARRLALRAGSHTITVEKSGFEPQSREVAVRALGIDYASFALSAEHHTPLTQRWWLWAAVGTVVIAAGVTYAATRDPAPQFPGVTCDSGGCHP